MKIITTNAETSSRDMDENKKNAININFVWMSYKFFP